MQVCNHKFCFYIHQLCKINLEYHYIIALPSTFKKDKTAYTMFSDTRKNYILGFKRGITFFS